MATDDLYADNQANWDDRARVHVRSDMYSIDEYASNPGRVSDVVTYDIDQMGPVDGLHIAHLQCHVGTDTISFERLGAASVVGLDFSPVAIEEATKLSERAGLSTRFVEASVYDAPAAVGHTVDLVYTGIGALCWLHDIDAWAVAVAGLLEPGGRFYVRDNHPFLFIFEDIDGKLVPHFNYWHANGEPLTFDEDFTYSDNPDDVPLENTTSHEWNHSLAAIVNALVAAGMRIDRIEEHQGAPWEIRPGAVREGNLWYLPEPLRSQVPVLFSLHATKL